jgi:hypothetical protein
MQLTDREAGEHAAAAYGAFKGGTGGPSRGQEVPQLEGSGLRRRPRVAIDGVGGGRQQRSDGRQPRVEEDARGALLVRALLRHLLEGSRHDVQAGLRQLRRPEGCHAAGQIWADLHATWPYSGNCIARKVRLRTHVLAFNQ